MADHQHLVGLARRHHGPDARREGVDAGVELLVGATRVAALRAAIVDQVDDEGSGAAQERQGRERQPEADRRADRDADQRKLSPPDRLSDEQADHERGRDDRERDEHRIEPGDRAPRRGAPYAPQETPSERLPDGPEAAQDRQRQRRGEVAGDEVLPAQRLVGEVDLALARLDARAPAQTRHCDFRNVLAVDRDAHAPEARELPQLIRGEPSVERGVARVVAGDVEHVAAAHFLRVPLLRAADVSLVGGH